MLGELVGIPCPSRRLGFKVSWFCPARDMNVKVIKVAKDSSPESSAWTYLGPGLKVVWGQVFK